MTAEKTSIAPSISAEGGQRLRSEASGRAKDHRGGAGEAPCLGNGKAERGDRERQRLIDQPVERKRGEDVRRRGMAAERRQQHSVENAKPGRDMAEDAERQCHPVERQQREIVDASRRQEGPEHARGQHDVQTGDGDLGREDAGGRQHQPQAPRQRQAASPRRDDRADPGKPEDRAGNDRSAAEPKRRPYRLRCGQAGQRGNRHQSRAEARGDEADHEGDVAGTDPERGVEPQADGGAAQRPEAGGLPDRIGRGGTRRDPPPGLRFTQRAEGVEVIECERAEAHRGQADRQRDPPRRHRHQRRDHLVVVGPARQPRQRDGRKPQHDQRQHRGQHPAIPPRPAQDPGAVRGLDLGPRWFRALRPPEKRRHLPLSPLAGSGDLRGVYGGCSGKWKAPCRVSARLAVT